MTEYFGFNIDEEYRGQFEDLVEGVDPYYHKAIACGLSFLCYLYGDKAYRQLDDWFTAIYATVMEMEDVMNRQVEQARLSSPMNDQTEPVFSPDAEEEQRLRQQTLRAAETLASGGEVGSTPVVVANLLAMYERDVRGYVIDSLMEKND